MALIASEKILDKEKIKLDLDQGVLAEINQYCSWANISNIEHFIEEAARFIFSKDKDWKNHLKSAKK